MRLNDRLSKSAEAREDQGTPRGAQSLKSRTPSSSTSLLALCGTGAAWVVAFLASCSGVDARTSLQHVTAEGDFEAYRASILGFPRGATHAAAAYSKGDRRQVGYYRDGSHWRTLDGCPPLCCVNYALCTLPEELGGEDYSRAIATEEWNHLAKLIATSGFWDGAEFEDRFDVYDGVSVSLEGRRGDEYRGLGGRNPNEDGLTAVVDFLFDLADETRAPPGTGSYDPERKEIYIR